MHRVAIYFAPEAGTPPARAAAAWFAGPAGPHVSTPASPTPASPAPASDALAGPRRYGFHATLKAPFRLAAGFDASHLQAALDAFAAARPPLPSLRLVPATLGSHVALVPAAPSPATEAALRARSLEIVEAFEPYRAPSSAAEIARRLGRRPSARATAQMMRYGYPHVGPDFRFHMTLAGPSPSAERDRLRRAAAAHFREALSAPVRVDALTLFAEPEPGAPFAALSRHPFAAEDAIGDAIGDAIEDAIRDD